MESGDLSVYEFFTNILNNYCCYCGRGYTSLEKDMIKKLYLLENPESSDVDVTSIISIEDLDLSNRAKNTLLRAGFRTLEDVLSCSIVELSKLRNMVAKSLKEILEVVKENGYSLPETLYVSSSDQYKYVERKKKLLKQLGYKSSPI